MEYEDTNILRTQYVDDLVNQRQEMENAMLFQNAPVNPGEGFSEMIPKVPSLTGSKSDIPYINFMGLSIPTQDELNQFNVYNWEILNYLFCDLVTSGNFSSLDLRLWTFGKFKETIGMFSSLRDGTKIYLNKSFTCEYVEDASDMFGGGFTSETNNYFILLNEAPLTFKNLKKADKMFSGIYFTHTSYASGDNKYSCLNPITIPSDKLESMVSTFHACNMNYADGGTTVRDIAAAAFWVPLLSSLNTKNVKSMSECFKYAYIPEHLANIIARWDCSSLKDMSRMFESYNAMGGTVSSAKLDLSKMYLPVVETFYYLFYNAKNIHTIVTPTVPNETLTTLERAFYVASSTFTTLDVSRINMGGVKDITNMLGTSNTVSLVYLWFGYNLGKAYYTTKSNNVSRFKVNLTYCSKLDKDCVVDMFQRLYDLNIAYGVYDEEGNPGTGRLYTQQIDLHADVIAKLTPEEIAIVTNKGWTVI